MLKNKLPVDIILSPEWWYRHEGITFDRDFFFHPLKRVESEQKMENALYKRWGKYGLGNDRHEKRPEVGAVHLAAGFLLSEMMGCRVEYQENHPPLVIPAFREDWSVNTGEVFKSEAFLQFIKLRDELKSRFGYLTGDVNWSGILNLALDLRGEAVLAELMLDPASVIDYFRAISYTIDQFISYILPETGTSSISVNRNVRYFPKPVFLHSECSHTMISAEDYENLLLEFDIAWSKKYRPFGVHYCGNDPHRHAGSFAKIPHLDFLDLGWGGDVILLREHLPRTFFNLRLSPVKIREMDADEIRGTITRLVKDSGDPYLTGVCCINMDDMVTDDKIDAIFNTVKELRDQL